MAGSPTFFSEGHTPVPNQPEEMILQKILGVLIDNGSSVTGPTKATQPQVDAGTPGDFYVSPLTLQNWQLPTGFTKIGVGNVQTNFEPVLSKKIYVSASVGTNTRTGLSKYNSFMPFLTIAAAVAVWAAGDTVWVTQGTYAEKNIVIPDGFSCYHELGANVTFSGVLAANDAIYTDNNVGLSTFNIRGDGAFSIHDSGNAQDGSVLRIRAGSFGKFECLSAIAGTSGTKGNAFFIDGNALLAINVKTTVSAQNNCFYTSTGSPTILVTIGQSISSPNGGFFCNAGTIIIGSCPQNTANLCMYVSAGGTAIYANVGIVTPSVNGIGAHGVVVGNIGTIAGAAGVYGVDGPASGTMNLTVGSITGITGADGRGITSRGAGTAYVTMLGGNTATIPIKYTAGTLTVNNGEHFGNNTTASVQTTLVGASQRLNLNNAVVRNANASGSCINLLETASDTIFLNGCTLISGATNSITGTATATYTVMMAYTNKIANAGLVLKGNAAGFIVSTDYT